MRGHKICQTKRVAMAAGTAVFLSVLGGGALFARAGDAPAVQDMPVSSFREAKYDMLRALQLAGFEDMTVHDYQEMIWEKTDTPEYRELLERMSASEVFYEKRDDDALAHFLFYVLEPLTAERWQTRDFGGCAQEKFSESGQTAMVEYSYTLTITDANALTVREYMQAQDGIEKRMAQFLEGKSEAELADEDAMRSFLDAEVERLKGRWSTQALTIDIEFCFQPLEIRENEEDGKAAPDEQEPRTYPHGTKEDYRSLLALKTADYADLPLQTFNMRLLEWANENYERMERIGEDTGMNDFAVELDEEELDFVTRTVLFSGKENGAYVRSNYTGRAGEDAYYQENLPEKGGGSAWNDLYYMFTWHIADKKMLTVGERDRMVGGMIDGVQLFWEETAPDVLLRMEKMDVVKKLQEIAGENSGAGLTLSVRAEDVGFESYDERGAYDRLVSYRVKNYEKLSVADFHAMLCGSEDEFGRLLDANAELTGAVTAEDKNYDFLENTMSVSLSELYCEKFGEDYGIPVTLVKQARPYSVMDDGMPAYNFWFCGSLWISYTMSKENLTVGERNAALQKMKDGLQAYVDGLSEEQIFCGDARKLLKEEGERLAKKLSGEKMTLMCEVQMVEMCRDGAEYVD